MNSHFNNTRPANAPAATLLEAIADYRRHLIVERTYEGQSSARIHLDRHPLHSHDCRSTKDGAGTRAGERPFMKQLFCGINFMPFILRPTDGRRKPRADVNLKLGEQALDQVQPVVVGGEAPSPKPVGGYSRPCAAVVRQAAAALWRAF
jgi:hypothetical protein